MEDQETMSGNELRQYLHISTRKLKYLMDHDYIPHENNGQTTHKYRVRVIDAQHFKYRMEHEPGFLVELTGCFSSRPHKERSPLLEPTELNRQALQTWLMQEWLSYPDALPVKTAAALWGRHVERVHELVKDGKLHSVKIGSVQLIPKEEFIAYLVSPEVLTAHISPQLTEIIIRFKKRQSRLRENERKRERRKSAR